MRHPLSKAVIAAMFCLTPHWASALAGDVFTLRSSALAESNIDRSVLEYLVGCSLKRDQIAILETENETLRMQGSLGLAPEWQKRALNRREQELVTGCILARTNAFGVPVQISIRGRSATDRKRIKTSLAERESHTLYEATYFGNLFAANPVAFACRGEAPPEQLVRLKRICSLPSSVFKTSTDSNVSLCGMVVVGQCTEQFPVMNGYTFRHAIDVYLRPSG